MTCAATALVLPLSITSARAQTPKLSQLLPELILRDITLDSPPIPAGVPGTLEGSLTSRISARSKPTS